MKIPAWMELTASERRGLVNVCGSFGHDAEHLPDEKLAEMYAMEMYALSVGILRDRAESAI